MNARAIPWVRPRLLWIPGSRERLEVSKLERPQMLVACAAPHEVGMWRTANRWADHLPCVTFMGDDADGVHATEAVSFGPRCPRLGAELTPYRVDNAPVDALESLTTLADVPYQSEERDAVGRYLSALRCVCAYGPPIVWFILAESDGGLGAVEVAKANGACVALCNVQGGQLGLMATALANRLGVDVAVHGVGASGVS